MSDRVFWCPQCASTWTMPDPGHDLPVMAVCGCAGLSGHGYTVQYQLMTEISPPAPPPRIVLQIVRTELA